MNQDRAVGGGDLFDLCCKFAHDLRLADEHGHDIRRRNAGLEGSIFLNESAVFNRSFHGQDQLVTFKGLLHKVKSALFHGRDRHIDRAIGSHQHQGELVVDFLELHKQSKAVHLRHLQVRDHGIGTVTSDHVQCGNTITGRNDLHAGTLKRRPDTIAHDLFVIDDEDFTIHKRTPWGTSA